ncbi:MAG: hypothetical protein PHC75_04815 [Burkholderiales bacterium]|nr:hypothetical protein [Burkholderiales bacterium]
MKKMIAVMGLSLLVKSVFALPELAIPDLIYSDTTDDIGVENADVRGLIAKSGKFKVIHVPKNFDTHAVFFASNESSIEESAPKLNDGSKYILIGEVSSANWNDSNYAIPNTSSYSVTRSVNMVVSYKLVRIVDKEIVASFSVTPSSFHTSILKANEKSNSNKSKMMKDISMDLATQVLNEITHQNPNSVDYGDKPMVSSFKTYDN